MNEGGGAEQKTVAPNETSVPTLKPKQRKANKSVT